MFSISMPYDIAENNKKDSTKRWVKNINQINNHPQSWHMKYDGQIWIEMDIGSLDKKIFTK